jgi:hypothetical protein
MFSWLRSLGTKDCILELHSESFRVRDLAGMPLFDFKPVLAVDNEDRVASIGLPIAESAVKTYAPFESPTALAKDRRIAELLLQFTYSKLAVIAWLRPAPAVVLHVPGDRENRARLIDDKTLVLLSKAAGARKTVVYRGSTLSATEARRRLASIRSQSGA